MKSHLTRYIGSVAVAAALIAGGAEVLAAHAAARPTAHASRSPKAHVASTISPSQVDAIALSVAAQNGDRSPTSVQTVQTTHTAAYSLLWPGAGNEADTTPAYVTTMKGSFTANNGLLPAGAPAPTGNVLTIVVNAQTGQMMDLNLSNRTPDLSQLGTVMNMELRRAAVVRGSHGRNPLMKPRGQ